MNVRYEELSDSQRAGGIETATAGIVRALSGTGVEVARSSCCPEKNGARNVPDCIHVHGIWSPDLMRRWQTRQKFGLPAMVSIHGMLEPWALAHKAWKKRMAWWTYQKHLLQRADCLHATSVQEADNLRKLGLQSPIAVIPWGIDRVKMKSKGGAKQIRTTLFVGRLYPVKGLPLLIEAWARVRPAGWRLQLIGPDEAGHRAFLETMVRQCGLDEVVTFAGPMSGEALAEEYRNASLFVLPSHTENFGMVVGEAMAHGVPVITTHGAPWQVLEQEGCGWWMPVSVEGIAAALEDATQRPVEELAAMGERARDVVAERFSWDGIARDFVACYEWVLGRGEKPDCVVC